MITEEKVGTTVPREDELTELGFILAAQKVKENKELARKLRIAFEHFTVVTAKHITDFNTKLLEKTKKVTDKYGSFTHQVMFFTRIENYTEVPPPEVLTQIRKAKSLGCFDYFEIAKIRETHVSKVPVPDPIVFGCIAGVSDKYYIAQWDDDVRIEDILKEDEILKQ